MTISDRLTQAAHRAAQTRAAPIGDAELSNALRLVKDWQAYRLTRTYPDLLETPRYRDPARFFLHDLYGPADHARRDSELTRVIPALIRFLPEPALATICEAIELDALSEVLDLRVAQQLRGRSDLLAGSFERQAYAAAYRAAGTSEERLQQIALIASIGRALDRLVRKPVLSGLIAAMGPAARVAGLSEMHEFLQRGFRAFKAMGGAQEFLRLVDSRERRICTELFAGNDAILPE